MVAPRCPGCYEGQAERSCNDADFETNRLWPPLTGANGDWGTS